MFEAAFLDLMQSTVTHRAASSVDPYLKPTMSGTTSAIPAKVTFTRRVVRTSNTESYVEEATVHIPPAGYIASGVTTPLVAKDDRIVLPDTQTYLVAMVTIPYDEDGTAHHQRLSLTGG